MMNGNASLVLEAIRICWLMSAFLVTLQQLSTQLCVVRPTHFDPQPPVTQSGDERQLTECPGHPNLGTRSQLLGLFLPDPDASPRAGALKT